MTCQVQLLSSMSSFPLTMLPLMNSMIRPEISALTSTGIVSAWQKTKEIDWFEYVCVSK